MPWIQQISYFEPKLTRYSDRIYKRRQPLLTRNQEEYQITISKLHKWTPYHYFLLRMANINLHLSDGQFYNRMTRLQNRYNSSEAQNTYNPKLIRNPTPPKWSSISMKFGEIKVMEVGPDFDEILNILYD